MKMKKYKVVAGNIYENEKEWNKLASSGWTMKFFIDSCTAIFEKDESICKDVLSYSAQYLKGATVGENGVTKIQYNMKENIMLVQDKTGFLMAEFMPKDDTSRIDFDNQTNRKKYEFKSFFKGLSDGDIFVLKTEYLKIEYIKLGYDRYISKENSKFNDMSFREYIYKLENSITAKTEFYKKFD